MDLHQISESTDKVRFDSGNVGYRELNYGRSEVRSNSKGNPYLEIVVQPQSKFRFRYKSEMTGKHGKLLGVELGLNSSSTFQNGQKTYPTVKLHNFTGHAILRCSLVCESSPHYPHPHILDNSGSLTHSSAFEIEENLGSEHQYVEIPVSKENDHTAIFHGMNILYTGRKTMKNELLTKMARLQNGDPRKLSPTEVDKIIPGINLNVVLLCFEAIIKDEQSQPIELCQPVFSTPINHNKSIHTGDLRIVRIDKCTSCCNGNEEVFILIEKVDKHNIQVKFFELNEKGNEIWKAYAKFNTLDVHHQYAIVFKTPPYKTTEIDTEVDIWIALERPSDGATSEKIPFKYKPIGRMRKMPKKQLPRHDQGPNTRNDFTEGDAKTSRERYSQGAADGGNLGDSSSVAGSSDGNKGSVKQGSDRKFPLDYERLNQAEGDKGVALNVALNVSEGLHSWAETSDFTCVLSKLRHLLCLVNEDGNNALHTAVINQQIEPFERILTTIETFPDISNIINLQNLHNLTPLALAVLTNSAYFVRQLICRGADMTIPNSEGDLPVHLAAKTNNINCLKHLVESPSSTEAINCFNYNSMTPIHIAVSEGHIEAVNMLCSAKANLALQEGTYGRTPLHFAVEKCSYSMCLVLLKAAGDVDIVNVQNYRGDTPLFCAATSTLPAICALLLYFGADPNVANFVSSDESDRREYGQTQTVFDVVSNSNIEIHNILNGNLEVWEKTLKSYTSLTEYKVEREKLLSIESLHVDSGIDIKESS